jgi:hypothetical protein
MPAKFNKCVKDGGNIKTIDVNDTQYMHVCYLNGESHAGEVKTKVSNNNKTKGKNMKLKINPEDITGIIKKSLDSIAEAAVKNLTTEKKIETENKDEKSVTVNINVDHEKLSKAIVDGISNLNVQDDDEEDESVTFQKSLDNAKSKSDLIKIRDTYKLDVRVRGEIPDIKKSLKEAYFIEEEETDNDKEKEKKEVDVSSLSKAMLKAIKELGINPNDVKAEFEIKGKKKSLVFAKEENEKEKFDNDDNDGDGDSDMNDEKVVSKSFRGLDSEDKDEVASAGFDAYLKGKKK